MRVLDGDIDNFITVARRAGEHWYVGSLTNRDQRMLRIPLSFLEPGIQYQAFIGEDAEDTHYLDNKETYCIRNKMVTSDSVISTTLAPGGGTVIRLEPVK